MRQRLVIGLQPRPPVLEFECARKGDVVLENMHVGPCYARLRQQSSGAAENAVVNVRDAPESLSCLLY